MSANTFGTLFTLTECGESHGLGLMAIVDGVPPQIELCEEDIQKDLDRRRPGSSIYGTPRNEPDKVKIMSGVFEGVTTGTPIGLLIENTAQRSSDYNNIKDCFRPGHADFTYFKKYGIRDYRGGGRASARETAMRVAAGAIAKKILHDLFSVEVKAGVIAIGPIKASVVDLNSVSKNAFNFTDASKLLDLENYYKDLMQRHDSCGAIVEIHATNVPVGLGSPVFDRLDATLSHALMSINAVKGVEIGDGFALASMEGSVARDLMDKNGFLSNHQGGILGGISTGQDIIARIALKPTSSITIPGRSIDKFGNEIDVVTKGRHDPCVGIRAVPIAEAMVAITLLDALLCNKGQCFNVNQGY